MPRITIIAIDLVATGILVFGLYFPRHRRRDMVVAYLGLNVGVLTVALALSANTSIGTGFGLGLFGALSIIRLRSSELGHEEVAYYFAALALGLLGGIEVDPPWVAVALPAAIIAVMFVGDNRRLFRDHRLQVVTLDRAIADERQLTAHLEHLLGAHVERLVLRRLDMVNDSTVVEVRYRLDAQRASMTTVDSLAVLEGSPA
ncbi:MAG TPA: DUF4956 domain-containing protein [Ilumatobacteraceae bacterium]|mgnify:CR=1 FL=1|jgi:hypothetical protein|nr:DUF4956 domain-containing protein [Acidimicrobiaceae bacterium]HQY14583.1 DUF4956 domain-containing protein [Ilumatobacteraceae bacterium]HQZ37202.1 DUF4956 domain-containing protein [Ilumatobacteraceae bacterium]